MTIEELLKYEWRSEWLDVPGFSQFYARSNKGVFVIANVIAICPGSGVFSRLLERYKETPIRVEGVLDEARFGAYLLRRGFRRERARDYFRPPASGIVQWVRDPSYQDPLDVGQQWLDRYPGLH
jgi:hypothetical protein